MSRPEWTKNESSTSACFIEAQSDSYNTLYYERICYLSLNNNKIEPMTAKDFFFKSSASFCLESCFVIAEKYLLTLAYCLECLLLAFNLSKTASFMDACSYTGRKFQQMTGMGSGY